MIERKPIRFSKWTPVERDNRIVHEYAIGRGQTVFAGGDRWMRAKRRIAASAIASGVTEFTVHGGLGSRRWTRTVTVTQDEADDFFQAAIERGDFMLKGTYRNVCAMRARRFERERSS